MATPTIDSIHANINTCLIYQKTEAYPILIIWLDNKLKTLPEKIEKKASQSHHVSIWWWTTMLCLKIAVKKLSCCSLLFIFISLHIYANHCEAYKLNGRLLWVCIICLFVVVVVFSFEFQHSWEIYLRFHWNMRDFYGIVICIRCDHYVTTATMIECVHRTWYAKA